MIKTHVDEINKNVEKGLLVFAGIDQKGNEIYTMLVPQIMNKVFYYSCSNKFDTHLFEKCYDSHTGSIIFVNGDEYYMYKFNNALGRFDLHKAHASHLLQKHNKGGQSAQRFDRQAMNDRHRYTLEIIEHMNTLGEKNNWIFGSADIIDDVFKHKSLLRIKVMNGGYVKFDKTTINDTATWITFIQKTSEENEKLFETTSELFIKNPDILCFDPEMFQNLDQFTYILVNPEHELYDESMDELVDGKKVIKVTKDSKFYAFYKPYPFIGVYHFTPTALFNVI